MGLLSMGLTNDNTIANLESPEFEDFMLDILHMDGDSMNDQWQLDFEDTSHSPSMATSPILSPEKPQSPQKSSYQSFYFVDQTPIMKSKISRSKSPVDLDKSRIAQSRRRDVRGKFIKNEIAQRLEGAQK